MLTKFPPQRAPLPISAAIMFALLLWAGELVSAAPIMQKPGPLKTVPHVDIPRYMGDWFVIANIPYFAERNCYDSIESYRLRPDGRIDNWFTVRNGSFEAPLKRKASALATIVNKQTNAEWRVRFFGFISVPYLVIDLDPHYRWAVVGYPSRKLGWVLARTKKLPSSEYAGILKRLSAQGYDPAKFVLVPQRDEAKHNGGTPAH